MRTFQLSTMHERSK